MLAKRIYEWAALQPAKPAVISNRVTLRYADFARAIEAARAFFEPRGFEASNIAIVLASTLEDAWLFSLALRSCGLHTICVQSLQQADSLKLRNVACVVVSEGGQQGLKLAGTALERTPVVVVPSAIFAKVQEGELPQYPESAVPFGGHILLTSGTTGAYKKLLLAGAHEDRRNSAPRAYSLRRDMTFHVANFGPWTSTGFRMPSAVWHTGGCVVMDTSRDLFRRFFDHKIDLSILTPPMHKELVQSFTENRPAQNDCELIIAAGFLPFDLAEETIRRVTRRLEVGYGATELGTLALLSRETSGADLYWLSPGPHRALRIVDEDGNDCAPGQEGELRIRLIEVDCESYLDDAEASAQIFRDGYFCPGDLAVGRADGRVRILGRTADVLNIHGLKVAVAPVEMAVQRLLKVDEVCLFSGLDEMGKEELVVAVQTDRELPRAELELTREFPSFERVRVAVLKEFPRTTAGTRKTRRSELRKMLFPNKGL